MIDQPMIVAAGITKWFGSVVAVSDVSFSIGPGVTALLGPNGAGKSTVMRMLCGLTPPSKGTLTILGGNPRKDVSLTRRIGLVPQQDGLFDQLTAAEFVGLAATLHQLDDVAGALTGALELVHLDPADPRPLRTYSKGMKQRVKIAQALVHDPDVVFLDEPLTGLDPRQRLHMIELFALLGARGKCVVVSSHVLEEVERFGSRVLVIVQGRLAAEGDFHAIRDLMDERPHRIGLRSNDVRSLCTGLLDGGAIVGVQLMGTDRAIVDTAEVATFRRTVASVAQLRGVSLLEVRPLDDDLESVFKYLVGR